MYLNCGHQRACCTSQMIYEYGKPWWNDTDREKQKNSEKALPCHSAHRKSHTDDADANPGLRGEKLD
jgi:hypothetical protein